MEITDRNQLNTALLPRVKEKLHGGLHVRGPDNIVDRLKKAHYDIKITFVCDYTLKPGN